jgi:hypothetical protein
MQTGVDQLVEVTQDGKRFWYINEMSADSWEPKKGNQMLVLSLKVIRTR